MLSWRLQTKRVTTVYNCLSFESYGRHKDVKKTHFIGKLTGSQTMLLNKG